MLRDYNSWISGIITASVLIGGFTMRYVVIYAGQMAQIITSWALFLSIEIREAEFPFN